MRSGAGAATHAAKATASRLNLCAAMTVPPQAMDRSPDRQPNEGYTVNDLGCQSGVRCDPVESPP
jgi:hypothetical protein